MKNPMSRMVLYMNDDKSLVPEEGLKTNAFTIGDANIIQPVLNFGGKRPLPEGSLPKSHAHPEFKEDYLPMGTFPMADIVSNLHKVLNISEESALNQFVKTTQYYNRFKVPTINDAFVKGYSHIFFVRPSCNILNGGELTDSLSSNAVFGYAMNNCPSLLKELTLNDARFESDFMLSLSNKVSSFSLNDEYIGTDTYGKTFTGYKIGYGKNNIESKTAGTLNIGFDDDKFLHIYQIHKLWTEYISGVSRGEIYPIANTIKEKILDYAGAIYYIMTAEDNETIVFWSKYYGVFPTTIPSSQYSWSKGQLVQTPTFDVSYMFSFKEDYNPLALFEFNQNARVNSNGVTYAPMYDKTLGHTGTTWVGAPFIELIKNDAVSTDTSVDSPYTFKLRFREKD